MAMRMTVLFATCAVLAGCGIQNYDFDGPQAGMFIAFNYCPPPNMALIEMHPAFAGPMRAGPRIVAIDGKPVPKKVGSVAMSAGQHRLTFDSGVFSAYQRDVTFEKDFTVRFRTEAGETYMIVLSWGGGAAVNGGPGTFTETAADILFVDMFPNLECLPSPHNIYDADKPVQSKTSHPDPA